MEFNSDYLEQIIELSSVSQITNVFRDIEVSNSLWQDFDDSIASDSLAQACYHGLDDKIITTLTEAFATNKTFTKNQKSVVALLQAFEQGHLHCIKILRKYLTEEDFINTRNSSGNSCLVISIKNNYYDCVQYIMDNFTQDAIKKMMTDYFKYYRVKINNRMKKILESGRKSPYQA